jgi:sulfate adenylyltransferase
MDQPALTRGAHVPPTSDAELRALAAGLPEVAVGIDVAGAVDLVVTGALAAPTPIELPTLGGAAGAPGDRVAVRDLEGVLLGVVEITSVDGRPSGTLVAGRRPDRPDYPHLWATPDDVRQRHPQPVAALIEELPPTTDGFAGLIADVGGRLLVLALAPGAPDDPAHHARVRAWVRLTGPYGAAADLVLVPRALPDDPAAAYELRRALAASYGADAVVERPDVDPAAGRPPASGGATVLLTGLSGSGKSTIAGRLLVRLLAAGRTASLLDGDVVRTHLSKGLGFSKEDRDVNVRRIGFVAAEITKHGGIAIAAPIAPYDATRQAVRAMVERYGAFVLVHVATPLEVCEQRDRKGLYAKARAGEIPEFTGVSDPYEEPGDADIVIDTAATSADDAAGIVLEHLRRIGVVPKDDERERP